jgi:hypothetical protein
VNRSDSKWGKSAPWERVFKALRAPAQWHTTCLINVRIGDAAANPKEGITMKKLTTRLMIATAALVVAAGAASAQTMTASIPFEFRAGNRVMAPGTYGVQNLSTLAGTPIFRLLNVNSGELVTLLPQAKDDPQKAWKAEGKPKLAFACTSGSCALAELWDGSGSYAYTFHRPKLGKDETAVLREIPLQPAKGE